MSAIHIAAFAGTRPHLGAKTLNVGVEARFHRVMDIHDLPTVMTYREAVEVVGRARLRWMKRAGHIQQPCRGIYVMHNGPLTTSERDLVALKSCGARSALAGLSALAYDGFEGFDASRATVSQPIGASLPPYPEVNVHWSKWLDERDVHPTRTPRRTRPQRSLLDAASWAVSDPQARLFVIAGVQQGLVPVRQLREALQRRGKCRRRSLIIESILDARGGIQSIPERDFREICRQFGLPQPTHQVPCKGADGRYYLDTAWDEFDLTAEVHGIPHLRIEQWDGDLDRSNEVAIIGKHQLSFSSYAVRHHREHVGDQLFRMLVALGWRPADERIAVVPR